MKANKVFLTRYTEKENVINQIIFVKYKEENVHENSNMSQSVRCTHLIDQTECSKRKL